ncbi:MAG TPA: helix-turn-helix domain-containing protein [Candidatus Angelobacter sp.]|jgi:hypothetical protein|nr:helix-turn-helix domain-containing protein [Candidatus Angelobacter sp.]
MSNKAMTHVWEYSAQRGNALLVLLAIADMANDDLICYPGKAHLSKKCRVGVRGLSAILQKLEESGELKILRRQTGQRNKTNIYRIVVNPDSSIGNRLMNRDSLGVMNPDSLPDESRFTTPDESRFTTLMNPDSPKPLFNPKKESKEKRDLTPFDLLIAKDEEL